MGTADGGDSQAMILFFLHLFGLSQILDPFWGEHPGVGTSVPAPGSF
jgi:hypothetical protein